MNILKFKRDQYDANNNTFYTERKLSPDYAIFNLLTRIRICILLKAINMYIYIVFRSGTPNDD